MNKRHRGYSGLTPFPLLLAAALLAGCTKDEAPVIERYKAQGLAQLERIRGVSELMKDHSPLMADTPSLPFAAASFQRYGFPRPDGALVFATWLTEEGLRDDSPIFDSVSVIDEPFWGRSGAWLLTGKNPDGSPPTRRWPGISIEEELQNFVKVKYLGVVRTVEFRNPEVTGENEYRGGRYRADVFFFDLADEPKYLGGLRVNAANDPEMEFRYREATREADMKGQLEDNLESRSKQAIDKVIAEHAKGSAANSQPSK